MVHKSCRKQFGTAESLQKSFCRKVYIWSLNSCAWLMVWLFDFPLSNLKISIYVTKGMIRMSFFQKLVDQANFRASDRHYVGFKHFVLNNLFGICLKQQKKKKEKTVCILHFFHFCGTYVFSFTSSISGMKKICKFF